MSKLPNPPKALPPLTQGDLVLLRKGTLLWRIYPTAGAHATRWNELRTFGPTSSRFDHHAEPPHSQTLGILYGAVGPHGIRTCIAEFFQETRTIDTRRREPHLVGLRLRHDVRLLNLRDTWPTRAGASMAINSGPRPQARKWSRAIYASYDRVQGLYYSSSMNANEPAVALYERAQRAMPAAPTFDRPLSDRDVVTGLLRPAMRVLGYLLTPP
jgi:hypothetical protein